jgi:hypothetical protein
MLITLLRITEVDSDPAIFLGSIRHPRRHVLFLPRLLPRLWTRKARCRRNRVHVGRLGPVLLAAALVLQDLQHGKPPFQSFFLLSYPFGILLTPAPIPVCSGKSPETPSSESRSTSIPSRRRRRPLRPESLPPTGLRRATSASRTSVLDTLPTVPSFSIT